MLWTPEFFFSIRSCVFHHAKLITAHRFLLPLFHLLISDAKYDNNWAYFLVTCSGHSPCFGPRRKPSHQFPEKRNYAIISSCFECHHLKAIASNCNKYKSSSHNYENKLCVREQLLDEILPYKNKFATSQMNCSLSILQSMPRILTIIGCTCLD